MDSKTNSQNNKPRIIAALIAIVLIVFGLGYFLKDRLLPPTPAPQETPVQQQVVVPSPSPNPSASPLMSPLPLGSPSPGASLTAGTNMKPDLTVDAQGLSNATAVIRTDKGIIRFKFYTNDAPNTVNRIVELINSGFYNGLTFHRVIPGFVIQGGDPTGTGAGGSGQKLKAEFNNRRHVEGTVAMARAQDPDSADSQFYISLGVHPHLDHQYTVFGQVISGMDVAKKIAVGDRMLSVTIE